MWTEWILFSLFHLHENSSRWPKSMMAFRRKHLVVRRFVDKLQCKTFVFNVCHWNNTNEKAIAIAIPLAKNRFYIFLVSIQTRKTSQIEHFIPEDFSSSSVCHSSISRFRCSQNHRTHTELLRNIYTHIIFGVDVGAIYFKEYSVASQINLLCSWKWLH